MKRRPWLRRRELATHADDWLMTYADMITLLFCLFAVLLSLSLHQKITLPKTQAVQQKVAAPEPVRPPATGPEKLSDEFKNDPAFHGLPPREPLEESTAEPAKAPPIINPPLPAPDLKTAPPVQSAAPTQAVEAREPAVEPASNPPAIFPQLPDPGQETKNAAIESKGDRITMLQMSSAAFFSSGSATLSDHGKTILHDVAVNLQSAQFKDYQITVEGHTDDSPISTSQFPSNWELSTARASAVVHFFLEQGIPATKLRAAGYADTFPVAPNRDANNNPIPENQGQNRRVVIKLEKIEKTEDPKTAD